MEEDKDVRLNEKLDRLIRLLGIIAVRELSQTEQIAILSRSGFLPKEIAEVVGTTSNTVRVALVAIRRDAKRQRSRKPKDQED